MRKAEIVRTFFTPIIELGMVVCVFFVAYFLRSITDGIPFVQLRIPYISEEQFIPFIISGTIIWGILFSIN